VAALVLSYLGPVRGLLEQREELGRQRAALTELEQRRDLLAAQVRALDQPAVLEARARSLGLVYPGERSFVVTGLTASLARAKAPERDDRGGTWDWLLHPF
jgi:hypothetical protein